MKLKSNPYWLKSGFYSILQTLSVLLFGFASFYLLVRVISVSDFGTWTLFLTIISVLEVVRNGLIRNGLIKFLNSNRIEEHGGIISASIVLNSAVTLIILSGMALAVKPLALLWEAPMLVEMFYIYFITAILLIPFSLFEVLQHANLTFKGAFYGHVTKNGIFFIIILYYYLNDAQFDLVDLVWFQLTGTLVSVIVFYFFSKQYLIIGFRRVGYWTMKQFHFGKYVIGTNLSSMIYKSIDQIMLGSLMSTAAVAFYNTAIRITNLVEVPTTAVSAIVFPQSAKRFSTDGLSAAKYLYERSVGVILALMLPAVVIIFFLPGTIISLIASDKYLSAVPILQITIFYTLFLPFARQFGTILDSVGLPNINFYITAGNALMNVILNYVFIRSFGMIGAAYGTLLTYFLGFILMQVVIRQKLKVELSKAMVHIFVFYKEIWVSFSQIVTRKQ